MTFLYYYGLQSGANAGVTTPAINTGTFARPDSIISSSTVVTTTSDPTPNRGTLGEGAGAFGIGTLK